MSQPPKIFASLLTEVVNKGLCMFCGACIAACPVNVVVPSAEEKPTLKGRCILCGLCYYSCPRVELPLRAIEQEFFGRVRNEKETVLGVHQKIWSVQSTDQDAQKFCQDGGVVTSLLRHALMSKAHDHAIVVGTESGSPWKPKAMIISDPNQLASVTRSKYTATGSIGGLAEAVAGYPDSKLAFVGVPCQIQALHRMHTRGNRKITEHIGLTIGLFCYNTYRYAGLVQEFLSKQHSINPSQITKMECADNIFKAFQNDVARIETPLEELTQFVLSGCQYCQDFTAELADLSVGHVGSEKGWCTVITRTQRGADLLKEATEAELVRCKSISTDDSAMNPVTRLSAKKKQREAPYLKD